LASWAHAKTSMGDNKELCFAGNKWKHMRQWNKEVTQGWRLVEVRGGAGLGLAFYRAEGRS
jgi:hypothetical protein